VVVVVDGKWKVESGKEMVDVLRNLEKEKNFKEIKISVAFRKFI